MLRIVVIATLCCYAAAIGDTQCTSQGGNCQDWRYYKCTAGYEQGLCSGDSNNRCCMNCDAACVSQENSYDDSACSGVCQDNSNYCDGSYKSGMCGGPADRQCCVTGSSAGCTLEIYSTSYVKGYNGLDVEIEPGFKNSMDAVNGYASSCSVTVWVTNAFRYEGQDLTGTVVPPASTSNHLVGHAIDFNLDTPSGWCNGDCLYAGYNSNAECFIQKVRNNNGLRWGGVWSPSDPVHIDDGLNVYNYNEWESLYYQLQGSC